jgi:hypothetical protein
MAIETLLTNEFCKFTIERAESDPNSLTAEQMRFLNYIEQNPKTCFVEGSRMINTCRDHLCVNPFHVKIEPPIWN